VNDTYVTYTTGLNCIEILSLIYETVVSILVNIEKDSWPSFKICILFEIVPNLWKFEISTKIINVCMP
jgi:hypothetical protein